MTDELERRGRHASAAVHARAGRLAPDHDLDRVLRRASRPRTGPVLALLVLALLAVPTAIWLTGGGGQDIEFADEVPTTDAETTEPTTPPATEPTATPQPGTTATPQPGTTASPSPEPGQTATPTETPQDGPQALGEFGTGEVVTEDFPFAGTEVGLLTDVRVAGQGGFDRLVLEFEGTEMPGYRVTYVDPPITQDGSGDEVAVSGSAFLLLHLAPASGADLSSPDGYRLTYEGPARLDPADAGVVEEFVRVGDFEANLSWVAGLRDRAPFSVTELSDPLRLVVDIQHP